MCIRDRVSGTQRKEEKVKASMEEKAKEDITQTIGLDGTITVSGKIRIGMVNGEIRNPNGIRNVRMEKDMERDMEKPMERDTFSVTIVEAMDIMQHSAKHM